MRHRNVVALLSMMVVAVAPRARAQAALPSGAALVAYDNVWRFSVRLADGTVKFQGLWTDHLESRDLQGRKIWLRVQGMTYVNGWTSSFVNAFELLSMKPVYSEVRGPKGNFQRRDFWPDSVVARRREPGAAADSITSVVLAAPVYDFFGGMYGVLLAAMPLRAGLKGDLPSIAEFTDSLTPAPYAVLRRERTKAGRLGERDAWVVESAQDGAKMTFWLTQEAPYIIRLEIANPNGSRTIFEML